MMKMQTDHARKDGAFTVAMSAPTVITGEVVATIAGWRVALSDAEFLQQWDDLAGHACEPNVFCQRWYVEAALNAREAGNVVAIAIVRSKGELIGVMAIEKSGRYAGLPVPHISNWLNHNAFLGTPLVRRNHESVFWQALLQALDCGSGSGLFLHVNSMPQDGPVAKALEAVCAIQGRRYACVYSEERALLERGLSPAAYWQTHVRSKKRKELRRQHNRLAELGDLQFERSDGQENLTQWTAEFLHLERQGWKGQNGSALDCAEDTRQLFHSVLEGAAAAGQLELLTLRLDGVAIAMLVSFLAAPGAFSFKTTFAESYARYSPGVLLQMENLKLLERSDIEWCDSCAAQDHPMIDSLWAGRRRIGRWSVAIGGPVRRAAFSILVSAEQAKARNRQSAG